MASIITVLGVVAYLWVFWYVYILVMGLYRAHLDKRLSRFTYVLAAPALVVGYAMDIVANVTIASVVFFEPPREWLVTSRLKRHIAGYGGWRHRLATWICDHLLDVFDPKGDHC
jgi:hypothetical protein